MQSVKNKMKNNKLGKILLWNIKFDRGSHTENMKMSFINHIFLIEYLINTHLDIWIIVLMFIWLI